jgi:large subunit ribosomal protein L25
MVQVSLVGHAPASDVVELVVLQNLLEIEVSALPAEIPSGLQADVSELVDVGDEVLVRDLKAVGGSYEPLTDLEASVAQVSVVRQVEDEPEEVLEEVLLGEGMEDGESSDPDDAGSTESADGDSGGQDETP